MLGKRIFVWIFLICHSGFAYSFEAKSEDILGMWLTAKKSAVVKIYKTKDNKYEGKIIWLVKVATGLKQDVLDDKNPDKKLRSRSLNNLVNLRGFSFDDGEWVDGKIYDPNSGKTYSAKMSLESKNTMNLRGYVGLPMFGKTSKWTRVTDLSTLPSK